MEKIRGWISNRWANSPHWGTQWLCASDINNCDIMHWTHRMYAVNAADSMQKVCALYCFLWPLFSSSEQTPWACAECTVLDSWIKYWADDKSFYQTSVTNGVIQLPCHMSMQPGVEKIIFWYQFRVSTKISAFSSMNSPGTYKGRLWLIKPLA